MDSRPPDSSVHGILQARILEGVAMPSSREDLPDPGIKPTFPVAPALQGDSSLLSHQGSSILPQRLIKENDSNTNALKHLCKITHLIPSTTIFEMEGLG